MASRGQPQLAFSTQQIVTFLSFLMLWLDCLWSQPAMAGQIPNKGKHFRRPKCIIGEESAGVLRMEKKETGKGSVSCTLGLLVACTGQRSRCLTLSDIVGNRAGEVYRGQATLRPTLKGGLGGGGGQGGGRCPSCEHIPQGINHRQTHS